MTERSRQSVRRTRRRRWLPGKAIKILAVALILWFLAAIRQEVLLGNSYAAANDASERELKRYQLESQRIEVEVRALDTPAGVERAARKYGWTMPNEKRLRIADR